MTHPHGKVYLVGGGPGDPGLITLRGAQCLARADAVLYDYLVNPRILQHAPAQAQLICLGRHGRDRIMPQAEINQRMVGLAGEGKTVVRLKGGDPVIFAHATEEIAALEAAGIAYEIVPGITAALAAGSYAGIPLTQGDAASAVALVTGHERDDKPTSSLDYPTLATFPGTLVFYMGVTTIAHWSEQLLAAGKPAQTPAAIVRRCTWPDQETIRCTLGTLAATVAGRRLRPPALVIVGPVAALKSRVDWFAQRPLVGTRVLATRAAHLADPLTSALEELGAHVVSQPAIEIGPPDDWGPIDQALNELARYDWLVFSSANGVRAVLDRLVSSRDVRALAAVKLAAIGPGTAEELARYHLRADLVPGEYRAEALAAALNETLAPRSRLLLIRASRGREVLSEQLAAAGHHVNQVVAYSSCDVAAPAADVAEQLRAGRIDWVTVSSSAIARSLAQLFGDDLKTVRLASISPVTTSTLKELGLSPAAEAKSYTLPGLVDAILAAEAADPSPRGRA